MNVLILFSLIAVASAGYGFADPSNTAGSSKTAEQESTDPGMNENVDPGSEDSVDVPEGEPKLIVGGGESDERVIEVYLMKTISVPEEEIKTSACPANAPYHKKCEKDEDCHFGFACMESDKADEKYCCAADEEVLEFAVCPQPSIAVANKWCLNDTECPEFSKCHKDFLVPEHIGEQVQDADVELEEALGICCSDRDVIPEALESCPKTSAPYRRGPCGVSIPGCPLGSECTYAGEAFGRCCGSPDAGAKTDNSNFYRGRFHGGFHGRGFHGFHHRGFHGFRGFHGPHFHGHFHYRRPHFFHGAGFRRYRYAGRK